ncbi:hypothetical protein CEXT_467061 [Caerostris extrusa]|uniref:Uncharacterized protein n=1 Tax=Caerostris extrusa TaxID=172846 RepID=A0AAV4UL62_CAEEX|nr:hypothetical protein CEXT_467061 [Caerostris extrusa]
MWVITSFSIALSLAFPMFFSKPTLQAKETICMFDQVQKSGAALSSPFPLGTAKGALFACIHASICKEDGRQGCVTIPGEENEQPPPSPLSTSSSSQEPEWSLRSVSSNDIHPIPSQNRTELKIKKKDEHEPSSPGNIRSPRERENKGKRNKNRDAHTHTHNKEGKKAVKETAGFSGRAKSPGEGARLFDWEWIRWGKERVLRQIMNPASVVDLTVFFCKQEDSTKPLVINRSFFFFYNIFFFFFEFGEWWEKKALFA